MPCNQLIYVRDDSDPFRRCTTDDTITDERLCKNGGGEWVPRDGIAAYLQTESCEKLHDVINGAILNVINDIGQGGVKVSSILPHLTTLVTIASSGSQGKCLYSTNLAETGTEGSCSIDDGSGTFTGHLDRERDETDDSYRSRCNTEGGRWTARRSGSDAVMLDWKTEIALAIHNSSFAAADKRSMLKEVGVKTMTVEDVFGDDACQAVVEFAPAAKTSVSSLACNADYCNEEQKDTKDEIKSAWDRVKVAWARMENGGSSGNSPVAGASLEQRLTGQAILSKYMCNEDRYADSERAFTCPILLCEQNTCCEMDDSAVKHHCDTGDTCSVMHSPARCETEDGVLPREDLTLDAYQQQCTAADGTWTEDPFLAWSPLGGRDALNDTLDSIHCCLHSDQIAMAGLQDVPADDSGVLPDRAYAPWQMIQKTLDHTSEMARTVEAYHELRFAPEAHQFALLDGIVQSPMVRDGGVTCSFSEKGLSCTGSNNTTSFSFMPPEGTVDSCITSNACTATEGCMYTAPSGDEPARCTADTLTITEDGSTITCPRVPQAHGSFGIEYRCDNGSTLQVRHQLLQAGDSAGDGVAVATRSSTTDQYAGFNVEQDFPSWTVTEAAAGTLPPPNECLTTGYCLRDGQVISYSPLSAQAAWGDTNAANSADCVSNGGTWESGQLCQAHDLGTVREADGGCDPTEVAVDRSCWHPPSCVDKADGGGCSFNVGAFGPFFAHILPSTRPQCTSTYYRVHGQERDMVQSKCQATMCRRPMDHRHSDFSAAIVADDGTASWSSADGYLVTNILEDSVHNGLVDRNTFLCMPGRPQLAHEWPAADEISTAMSCVQLTPPNQHGPAGTIYGAPTCVTDDDATRDDCGQFSTINHTTCEAMCAGDDGGEDCISQCSQACFDADNLDGDMQRNMLQHNSWTSVENGKQQGCHNALSTEVMAMLSEDEPERNIANVLLWNRTRPPCEPGDPCTGGSQMDRSVMAVEGLRGQSRALVPLTTGVDSLAAFYQPAECDASQRYSCPGTTSFSGCSTTGLHMRCVGGSAVISDLNACGPLLYKTAAEADAVCAGNQQQPDAPGVGTDDDGIGAGTIAAVGGAIGAAVAGLVAMEGTVASATATLASLWPAALAG